METRTLANSSVYLEAFGKAHPDIQVNLLRLSTGDLGARILAEKANPQLFGRSLFGGARERPSIDPTMGRDHLMKSPNYRGQMCTAGRDFVVIMPEGEVQRCGVGSNIGNLLDGTVTFRTEATPCDRVHCFYFCEKVTARAAAERKPLAAITREAKRAFAMAAR